MISILVSRCLLGENVRFDGKNCYHNQLGSLLKNLNVFPICPEVQAGMSIPRDPIELLDGKIINKEGENLTALFDPVLIKLKKLIEENSIEYALLKEDSPSCGVNRVYDGQFRGELIQGVGYVSDFMRRNGVKVYSEEELQKLKKDLNI